MLLIHSGRAPYTGGVFILYFGCWVGVLYPPWSRKYMPYRTVHTETRAKNSMQQPANVTINKVIG